MRVFENRHAAQAFEAHGFGDKAHIARFERLGFAASAQAIGDEQCEHAEALIQGVAHGGTGGLRQDRGADHGRAKDAQRDFQHSPYGGHERAVRVCQRGQTDHRGGVTGKDKTVGAEVAATRGAGRTDTDPDCQ